jgi:hypothetical protein
MGQRKKIILIRPIQEAGTEGMQQHIKLSFGPPFVWPVFNYRKNALRFVRPSILLGDAKLSKASFYETKSGAADGSCISAP